MELTYQIRGADGNKYGPATLQQVTTWAQEGRVQSQHEVRRSDMEHWSPAGSFSELQPVFASSANVAAPIATVTATATPTRDPATEAPLKSGASWFYWIAGLSLINSIVAFTGSDWRFILGLGITQVFDALGHDIGSAGNAVVLALDLLAAGVCVFFGVFAHKRHLWAFVVGMVLFALDGLIFLFAQDWLGVGFHVFVLYCLFRGAKACRELNAR
jgi:hypothetical protein